MRIAFYDCGFPNLGIQYLMAVTQSHGHDAALCYDQSFHRDYLARELPFARLFSVSDERIAAEMLETRPDIAAFPMNTLTYRATLSIAQALKRIAPALPIVCGGIHPTLTPETVVAEPAVDFVVVGEGEIALPMLMEALKNNDVETVRRLPVEALPGVWNMADGAVIDRGIAPLVRDLDTLPFPHKDSHYARNRALRTVYKIMAGRGCVGACTYCNCPNLNQLYRQQGKFNRTRTVENVLAELKWAKERYPLRYVDFSDDVFGVDEEWLREFAERYPAEIGLPYSIQANPLFCRDGAMELFAASGCAEVNFGIQTANAESRKHLLRRSESNERVRDLILRAHELKMMIELDLIVNLPGETDEHLDESLDFVAETRPEQVNMSYLQYFPKTKITQEAIAMNVLDAQDIEAINQGRRIRPMRALPTNCPSVRYLVLPFQLYLARAFGKPFGLRAARWMERPPMRWICASTAGAFIYLDRFIRSMSNKRDFAIRNQCFFLMYATLEMLRRKLRM